MYPDKVSYTDGKAGACCAVDGQRTRPARRFVDRSHPNAAKNASITAELVNGGIIDLAPRLVRQQVALPRASHTLEVGVATESGSGVAPRLDRRTEQPWPTHKAAELCPAAARSAPTLSLTTEARLACQEIFLGRATVVLRQRQRLRRLSTSHANRVGR